VKPPASGTSTPAAWRTPSDTCRSTGGEAKILAGGRASCRDEPAAGPPQVVVDINRISALAYIVRPTGPSPSGVEPAPRRRGSDAVTRRSPLLAEAALTSDTSRSATEARSAETSPRGPGLRDPGGTPRARARWWPPGRGARGPSRSPTSSGVPSPAHSTHRAPDQSPPCRITRRAVAGGSSR